MYGPKSNSTRRPRLLDAVRVLRTYGVVPLASSKGLSWEGIAVERYSGSLLEIAQPPVKDHIVSVALAPLRLTQVLAGRTHGVAMNWGHFSVIPSGMETRWLFDRPWEALHLRVEPEFLRRVAADVGVGNPDQVVLAERLHEEDPLLKDIGMSLLSELGPGAARGRLCADTLATVLAVHLLRHYSARPQAPREYPGGLSKTRLHRAFEYIHGHLTDDLGLADIARAANLSPYHFTRLFKQATGLPPHQYVLRQRVERARALLLSGQDLGLAAVAQQAGFYNESHLTRHCKRLLGTTPGKLNDPAEEFCRKSKFVQYSPSRAR